MLLLKGNILMKKSLSSLSSMSCGRLPTKSWWLSGYRTFRLLSMSPVSASPLPAAGQKNRHIRKTHDHQLTPKASREIKSSRQSFIFSKRCLVPRQKRAAGFQHPFANWAELNLMQMSSNNAEAAASCRLGCDCLLTARKVPSKHQLLLILHDLTENNNCGLLFPGAVWHVVLHLPWRT